MITTAYMHAPDWFAKAKAEQSIDTLLMYMSAPVAQEQTHKEEKTWIYGKHQE